MHIGSKGKGLIFIISQPRSGSTMLQRIIGSHPDIYTTSEPWLMLVPLRMLTDRCNLDGIEIRSAREKVQAFLSMFPNGNEEYIEGVRLMCLYLYSCALKNSQKSYFIDKTPRYSYLIPELQRTFPEALYIILFRNPLAVLCSVIKTWTGCNPKLLLSHTHRDDLVRAPHLLLEGINQLGKSCIIVHYENLVKQPENEIKKILDILGLKFVPKMVEYNKQGLPRWHFGDQSVYQYSQPYEQRAEEWQLFLRDPRIWNLSNDYLQLLGKEIVDKMGYPYEELKEMLKKNRPHRLVLWLMSSKLVRLGQSLYYDFIRRVVMRKE